MALFSITALPDLVQRIILGKLPIQDQLTAGRVCRKWRTLLPTLTLKVRSLSIIVGSEQWLCPSLNEADPFVSTELLVATDGKPLYLNSELDEWNTLKLEWLGEGLAEQIATVYPNIVDLTVIFSDGSSLSLNSLIILLEYWRDQLTSFKIVDRLADVPPAVGDRFFCAINAMTHLQHLSLDLYLIELHDLPILSKLAVFQYTTFILAQFPLFVETLRTYGETNQKLRQLEFETNAPLGDTEQHSFIEALLSLSERLRSCFRQIIWHSKPISNVSLWTHFGALTTLGARCSKTSLRRFFGHLSRLSQLVRLQVHFDLDTIEPDDQEERLLPQVLSVRVLHCTLNMTRHQQLTQINFGWILANVEVIDIDFNFSICKQCEVNSFFSINKNHETEKAQHCARLIFASLMRQCARLRTIVHNREHVLGTAAELLVDAV